MFRELRRRLVGVEAILVYALVLRVSARAMGAQRREYMERKLPLDRLMLLPTLRVCSLWERRLHRREKA